MLEMLAAFFLIISLGAPPPDRTFDSYCGSSCDPPIVVSGG